MLHDRERSHMTNPDRDYIAARARQERELARAATSTVVARVHAAFAERYEELLKSGPPEQSPSMLI